MLVLPVRLKFIVSCSSLPGGHLGRLFRSRRSMLTNTRAASIPHNPTTGTDMKVRTGWGFQEAREEDAREVLVVRAD